MQIILSFFRIAYKKISKTCMKEGDTYGKEDIHDTPWSISLGAVLLMQRRSARWCH